MGLKSTRHSKKKVGGSGRRSNGRRKTAKGGSRSLVPSRLSPGKENAIAEIKGREAAVKATQIAELAEIQADLARGAAKKATEVSDAIKDARMMEGYNGQVEDGKPHGFGVYDKGSTRYKGEWKYGKQHGVGVFIVYGRDGYRYEGDWKDDEMNGYGILVGKSINDRDIYMGSFKADQYDGYGVYTHHANGGIHKCEFKNGIKDGYGTYEVGALSRSGLFVDDIFIRGRGIIPLREGIYTGDLKNLTGTGNGKFIYHTGDVYEGQFKKYKRHGTGKLTKDNGTVEEGCWLGAGHRMKGTITYPDGHIEEGSFVDGVPLAPLREAIFSGEDTDRD